MEKYWKLFGYGAVIWGVAFIVVSAFIGFEVTSEVIVQGVTTLAVAIAAYLLARSLNISNRKEMLKYGFSWVVVGLILDLIVTTRFTGWQFFSAFYVWLGYALILLVPLLAVKKQTA